MQTDSIGRMLDKVQHLCLQRGVRLTPQRLDVLKLMLQQHRAISAYDLLDLFRSIDPKAKPPTIYRVLEFLLAQGFIHKIESTNSYIVCHHFDYPSHTSALFICDNCNSVAEHHVEGIENILQSIADKSGFNLKHSVIESHGTCRHCLLEQN